MNLRISEVLSKQNVAILGFAVIIISLISSRFMITMGMILLIANVVIRRDVLTSLASFFSNKILLLITSLFILHLISGLISADQEYYLERLRLKLPFLFLPFAIGSLQKFSKQLYRSILYLFFLTILAISIGSFINYLMNFEVITEGYNKAQVLPTAINHIRFSLMVAFAIVVGIFLYKWKYKLLGNFERYLILGGVIFLFAFIHILSVRSGLLSLYISILFLIGWTIYTSRKYLLGGALLVLLIAVPISAFYLVPSFNNKINYTLYDLHQYRKGKNPSELSDAKRLVSMDIGIRIGLENPVFGIGIGDLKDEMKERYAEYFPDISSNKRIMPHNQFIVFFAGFGFIGLIWLILVTFFPLVIKRYYTDPLFIAFNLIILSSFLAEATIENQLGTAFYLLFLLLGLNQLFQKNAVDG
ncbi:MAG: O-antigen ligase family protein [Bacteroidetes bacterium]|nr:O-antigen ligase family protein [Bacteroidota bacterium]